MFSSSFQFRFSSPRPRPPLLPGVDYKAIIIRSLHRISIFVLHHVTSCHARHAFQLLFIYLILLFLRGGYRAFGPCAKFKSIDPCILKCLLVYQPISQLCLSLNSRDRFSSFQCLSTYLVFYLHIYLLCYPCLTCLLTFKLFYLPACLYPYVHFFVIVSVGLFVYCRLYLSQYACSTIYMFVSYFIFCTYLLSAYSFSSYIYLYLFVDVTMKTIFYVILSLLPLLMCNEERNKAKGEDATRAERRTQWKKNLVSCARQITLENILNGDYIPKDIIYAAS